MIASNPQSIRRSFSRWCSTLALWCVRTDRGSSRCDKVCSPDSKDRRTGSTSSGVAKTWEVAEVSGADIAGDLRKLKRLVGFRSTWYQHSTHDENAPSLSRIVCVLSTTSCAIPDKVVAGGDVGNRGMPLFICFFAYLPTISNHDVLLIVYTSLVVIGFVGGVMTSRTSSG